MQYTTVARARLPTPRHSACATAGGAPAGGDTELFSIRLAHSSERAAAGALLARRYAWRGYHTVTLPRDQTGWRTTLTAHAGDDTPIGTLTLEIDGGPQGVSAAAAFGPEVGALRGQGLRVAEFTRLAVDSSPHSQRVLAGLFHVAYIVAHQLRGCDTLLLEVNPRHVRFYERMLGCDVIGPQRQHPGVQAPAVLLSAPFAYIRAQIRAYAGSGEMAGKVRSLYPFAFSSADEAGILARLLQAQQAVDVTH